MSINRIMLSAEDVVEDNQSGSDKEDFGTIANAEMDIVFKKQFYLEQEEAVSLKKNYVLHMAALNSQSDTMLGIGLSSNETNVYTLGTSLRCTYTIPAEDSSIVSIKFAPDNQSLLYVGCSKGIIRLWDLRCANKSVLQFTDTSDPKAKNLHEKSFCSFDVNSAGRFLCAGTEVTDGEAFLMFWDTRQASLLGGYWESHTDDITQVCFHPSEADRLVTGSTDGLINLYDISQSEEDEALLQCFNTESSVDKLRWHEGSAGYSVSCVTHTADVQLWHLDDSSPYSSFTRTTISQALQVGEEELEDKLYVTDVHSTSEPDQLMLLAGSNFGNGRCLRSVYSKSDTLYPHSYFDGNKQIVRCSWYNSQEELLVTGGEAGIVSVWKSRSSDETTSPNQLKATSKFKEKKLHKTKSKPY